MFSKNAFMFLKKIKRFFIKSKRDKKQNPDESLRQDLLILLKCGYVIKL